MRRFTKAACCSFVSLSLAACAPMIQRTDFTKFRQSEPHSVLVVPAVNRSVDVDAPDYLLATISRPIAERGYYVFPVNSVKRLMEDEGLADADLVHSNDPKRLGALFGTDAILYLTIERWDAQYVIFSTTVTVELSYVLKSAHTGETLWQNHEKMVYSPQNTNTGNPIATLVAAAITAAIAKAAPNYVPLAQQANTFAVTRKGRGLPAGPYDANFKKDSADF